MSPGSRTVAPPGRGRGPRRLARPAPPEPPEPALSPRIPKAGGINLKQLTASERSHQRLNKHNLTEGMIIDLVKKRKKRKIELECIFEEKSEFNIITLRAETDYNYRVSEVAFLIALFKIKSGSLLYNRSGPGPFAGRGAGLWPTGPRRQGQHHISLALGAQVTVPGTEPPPVHTPQGGDTIGPRDYSGRPSSR